MSIALPPPTATIVSTPSGTCDPMRRDFLPPVRGVENVAPARAGDDERPIARELRQLGEAPADDHFASSARANSTNASAARVAVRPAARTSEISRFASSPSTFADVSVPAASSDSTAEREMNATPYPACTALRTDSCSPSSRPHVEVAQAQPQAAQLVLDDLADAGAFLHHDHVLAAQLVDRDGASGEGMAGRAREDHLVVEERLEPGGAMPARRTDDSELELARGDALDHGLRVRDGQRDLDARVSELELAEQ